MEVVPSLSQGRTAAAQCGLFTHKSVPVIFEPPCSLYLVISKIIFIFIIIIMVMHYEMELFQSVFLLQVFRI